jgi:glycosyltransferase involved in cell wall biosynthesis
MGGECIAAEISFVGRNVPMRITIDDQIFIAQRRGGVSRYFTELITAFRDHPGLDVEAVTPFRYVLSEHLIERDPLRYRKPPLPSAAKRLNVIRTLNSVQRMSGGDRPGIVHHTYYYSEYLRRPAAARVCTIYDMIPERFPELFPSGNPHQAKDLYVQACDTVLCISNTTKADVLRHYGNLDKPVVVTPLGVGEEFFAASAADLGERPYVLFIGPRIGYKNFDTVLRAFSRLGRHQGSVRLLCVGGPPFGRDEVARIGSLNLQDRVIHRTVADNDLPALYASASCFVFPSLYEGFGLPIVEAFAAGCPVVLAEMECSVEVGADAAQFFGASDDEALAGIIGQMVEDPASRRSWIARGRKRALDYRWLKTARLTQEAYQNLAGVVGSSRSGG